MKKTFTITIFLLVSLSFVNAQVRGNKVSHISQNDSTVNNNQKEIVSDNEMAVGMTGAINIPLGDFNDFAKMGFGFSGVFLYKLSDNFQLTGSLGYLSWAGDKISTTSNTYSKATDSYTSVSLLGGMRYIFESGKSKLLPYAGLELGFHIFSSPEVQAVSPGEVNSDKAETNFYLGYALGGGVIYELSSNIKLDGSLYYNIINSDNSIGYFSLRGGFIVTIN